MFKTFITQKYIIYNLKLEHLKFCNATIIYIYNPFFITCLKTSRLSNKQHFNSLFSHKREAGPITRISNNLNMFYQCNKTIICKLVNKTKSLNQISFQTLTLAVACRFKKYMRVRGVGYKFLLNMPLLIVDVGYSHKLGTILPSNINVIFSRKFSKIRLQAKTLKLLTFFRAKIRKFRIPDIYKGKGIRYRYEYRKLKEGKKKKTF